MESESVHTRFGAMQFGRFRDQDGRPSPKAFVVSVSNVRQRQRIKSSKWRLVTRLLGLPQFAGMKAVDNPLLRCRMRCKRSAQEEGD
jgi:hypothetical protein